MQRKLSMFINNSGQNEQIMCHMYIVQQMSPERRNNVNFGMWVNLRISWSSQGDWSKEMTSRSKKIILRLLDTYASKKAKICDLKTFWPLRLTQILQA